MIDDHERRRTPAFTTRIISIAIKGSDKFPPPKTRARLNLLRLIVAALLVREEWPEIEAVVLPGGYFRLKRIISLSSIRKRFSRFSRSELATALLDIAVQLNARWTGVAVVIGIDSDALDKKIGGDQLVAVWQGGALVALTRKAFPVDGDTDGKEPVYFIHADDADDPGRLITLSNGAKALVLSCYDAFAVRGLHGRRHVDLRAIRLISTGKERPHEATSYEKRDHFRRWLTFLDAHPPDLGLIAIHRFRQAGQDGYWQRHGIAGASAALDGAPVVGAAHFRRGLPSRLAASPLASLGVPLSHLDQGAKRRAHRLAPQDGFTLRDEQGEAIAFLRLFTLNHGDDAS